MADVAKYIQDYSVGTIKLVTQIGKLFGPPNEIALLPSLRNPGQVFSSSQNPGIWASEQRSRDASQVSYTLCTRQLPPPNLSANSSDAPPTFGDLKP